MQEKDIWLGCMCISYIGAIYHVYQNYENNDTVSNILGNKRCNQTILCYMILMGVATLFYEYKRNDSLSFFLITWLLMGIYGILVFDETTHSHQGFALLVFFSMVGFMMHHCYEKKEAFLVGGILGMAIGLFDFFWGEVFLIGCFAVFYLYLV